MSKVYGRTPTDKIDVSYTLLACDPKAMDGKATCKQILFTFTNGKKTIDAILLLYILTMYKEEYLCLLDIILWGNQTTTLEPSIYYSPGLRFVHGKDSPVWTRGAQKTVGVMIKY